MKNFPDDDDGNVLQNLQNKGVDLNIPREIEFYCYAKNQEVALNISEAVNSIGYKTDVYFDDEISESSKQYSVYCAKNMVPTYHDIVNSQIELNQLLKGFDTKCDGWGTLS